MQKKVTFMGRNYTHVCFYSDTENNMLMSNDGIGACE